VFLVPPSHFQTHPLPASRLALPTIADSTCMFSLPLHISYIQFILSATSHPCAPLRHSNHIVYTLFRLGPAHYLLSTVLAMHNRSFSGSWSPEFDLQPLRPHTMWKREYCFVRMGTTSCFSPLEHSLKLSNLFPSICLLLMDTIASHRNDLIISKPTSPFPPSYKPTVSCHGLGIRDDMGKRINLC
jgi:hypothetical protein